MNPSVGFDTTTMAISLMKSRNKLSQQSYQTHTYGPIRKVASTHSYSILQQISSLKAKISSTNTITNAHSLADTTIEYKPYSRKRYSQLSSINQKAAKLEKKIGKISIKKGKINCNKAKQDLTYIQPLKIRNRLQSTKLI